MASDTNGDPLAEINLYAREQGWRPETTTTLTDQISGHQRIRYHRSDADAQIEVRHPTHGTADWRMRLRAGVWCPWGPIHSVGELRRLLGGDLNREA